MSAGASDQVPGRGAAGQGRGDGSHDYSYVDEDLVPTCSGNGLNSGNGQLCQAAARSCPGVGQVRFWIWHRRVSVAVGPPEVVTSGPWVQEPGSYCLGAADPGVPVVVTALARAQSVFEEKIRQLGPPVLSTSPGPRTLVHYDTDLLVANATPFTADVPVAGVTVHLSVRPLAFTWHLGPDPAKVTTGPALTYAFAQRGVKRLSVDVEWGGTFTVGGDGTAYDIAPSATSIGLPLALSVVQARAELVSR